MAMTAIDPRRIQAIGSFTELVCGVISVGTGNNTTLVLPQFSVIQGVICSGDRSDAVAVATTVSGNTITFDAETGTTLVAYVAFGIGMN